MELAGVLREAMSLGASDVHLKARQYPVLRVRGQLMRLENWPLLDGKDLEQMAGAMINHLQRQRFEREGGVDVQYTVAGIGRFRASIFRARANIGDRAAASCPTSRRPSRSCTCRRSWRSWPWSRAGLILVTGPGRARARRRRSPR